MKKLLIIGLILLAVYFLFIRKKDQAETNSEEWWLTRFMNYSGIAQNTPYNRHGKGMEHLNRLRRFHPEKISVVTTRQDVQPIISMLK